MTISAFPTDPHAPPLSESASSGAGFPCRFFPIPQPLFPESGRPRFRRNGADAENVVKYPKFAGGGKFYDYICEPLEGIPLLVSLREEERLGGRAAGAKGDLMTN